MRKNWTETTLNKVCSKIGSGATPRGGQDSYKEEGLSLIRSQNVLDLDFTYSGLAFIDQEQAEELANVEIQKEDVLINITGDSVARVCMVPEKVLPARVNQHVSILRANSTDLNPYYLKYYLINRTIKQTLLIMANSGATRNALTKGQLESFPILLPPLPEQKAIAAILSSLDDKIELLRRQNKTLEAIARTIFRKWFIEEAEKGWKNVRIGEFAKTNTLSINNDFDLEIVKYLDTSSIIKVEIVEFQYLHNKDLPSRAKRIVRHNDIVISTVRPDQNHYGIIKHPADNLIASTGFCVLTCDKIDPHYIYILLTTEEMTDYLHSIAEGTTSAYPSLKPSDIEKIEFRLPPKDRLKTFSRYAEKAWDKIDNNYRQIQTLSKLRDALLPKLMKGEIRTKS